MSIRVSPELAACSACVNPLALVTSGVLCVILSPGMLEGHDRWSEQLEHSSVCDSSQAGALCAGWAHAQLLESFALGSTNTCDCSRCAAPQGLSN